MPFTPSHLRKLAIMLGAMMISIPIMAGGQERPTDETIRKVRISKEKAHFLREGSTEKFIPWGFNYLGQHGRLAEDDWDTPAGWSRIKRDFDEMRSLGANAVRWHLQFETFMKGPKSPHPGNLKRLKELLNLARDADLYLNLTGLNCFRKDRIPEWYTALDEAGRWQAQAVFWSAIAKTCANDPVVFCYNLMNEPVIKKAAEGEDPWVTGELGGFYFVQLISNEPAGRKTEKIAEQWVEKLTKVIRKHDPSTLITVGVIPWTFVWPKAKPVFYSPSVSRHLDFVSIHVYPEKGMLEKELKALAAYDIGKPLVIEEVFPMKCSLEELDAFIEGSSDHVDGWFSHYFGHTAAEHRAGAKPGPLVAGFFEYWMNKGETLKNKKAHE
ncbi:MAG: cellulase family glycosylhydrolase [Akkermansiaceae bacterium]